MHFRRHFFSVIGVLAAGFALHAQDMYPHGGALDARQHGYEHGYRDGFDRGADAHAHNGNADFHTRDYDRADRGFEEYMGDHGAFKAGYREGYSTGYQDGFAGNRGRFVQIYGPHDRDFDADRDRGDRDRYDSVYVTRRWASHDVASDIGFRDGLSAGSKDATTGHSFRPTEHDSYKDGDHGYAGGFGSKEEYKRLYREGYMAGYTDGYGGRR